MTPKRKRMTYCHTCGYSIIETGTSYKGYNHMKDNNHNVTSWLTASAIGKEHARKMGVPEEVIGSVLPKNKRGGSAKKA
jgi:hypothetical protein